MPKNNMYDFRNAIGATAEITLTFYRDLLNSGADDTEAYILTTAFISSLINPTKGDNIQHD